MCYNGVDLKYSNHRMCILLELIRKKRKKISFDDDSDQRHIFYRICICC